MSDTDALPDAARLATLSQRLGIPARHLLIAAARLSQNPERANDPDYRADVLRDARNNSIAVEHAARLLLTPIGDYSLNEIETLFASVWPTTARQQDA